MKKLLILSLISLLSFFEISAQIEYKVNVEKEMDKEYL